MKLSFRHILLLLPGMLACSSGASQTTGAAPANLSATHGYMSRDGAIQIVGAAATERMIASLDALLEARHPGMRLHFIAANDAGAIDSLIFDDTLVAPVTSLYGGGIAYSDIVKTTPFYVRIAHASLQPGTRVSPFVIIVNPANPLREIALSKASSVFTKPLREPVLSHWSQMGVKLPSSDIIEPAGLPWTDHYPSEDASFGEEVFFRRFNGAPPVDDYRVFATYAEVARFVAREPGAIGIVPANQAGSDVRILGLVDGPLSKVRAASEQDLRDGSYPLDRGVYLYARIAKGQGLDPLATEYLRLALSAEGQAAIVQTGQGYIPLNATEIGEELAKLQ